MDNGRARKRCIRVLPPAEHIPRPRIGASPPFSFSLPLCTSSFHPDPADLLNFTLTITPDEGTRAYFIAQPQLFPPYFLTNIPYFMILYSGCDYYPHVGMYQGGAFTFSFSINTNYPHEPPKVKCIPKVSTALLFSHSSPTSVNAHCAFLLSSSDAFFVLLYKSPGRSDSTCPTHAIPDSAPLDTNLALLVDYRSITRM